MSVVLIALVGTLLSVSLAMSTTAALISPDLLDILRNGLTPALFLLLFTLALHSLYRQKKHRETLREEKKSFLKQSENLAEISRELQKEKDEKDELVASAKAKDSELQKTTFDLKQIKTAYEDEKHRVQELQQKLAESLADNANAMVSELLALLQQKGRFIDFLKDDITRYGDAQVGAAARIVHQGCAAVINEYFTVEPIRTEEEGSNVTVGENFSASEYRLLGKAKDEPPFNGRLVHHGWIATKIELPKPVAKHHGVIAPVEIELV